MGKNHFEKQQIGIREESKIYRPEVAPLQGPGMTRLKYPRETREGWPLLTVETEVNGDSKRTNKRGPSLVASLDSSLWRL
jgi:hypothetical protein